jgi:hypothetical protein
VGGGGSHRGVRRAAAAPALRADGAGAAGGRVPPAPPPRAAAGTGVPRRLLRHAGARRRRHGVGAAPLLSHGGGLRLGAGKGVEDKEWRSTRGEDTDSTVKRPSVSFPPLMIAVTTTRWQTSHGAVSRGHASGTALRGGIVAIANVESLIIIKDTVRRHRITSRRCLEGLHDEREPWGRRLILLEPEPALEHAPGAEHDDGAPGRAAEPPVIEVPHDVDGRAVDEDRLVPQKFQVRFPSTLTQSTSSLGRDELVEQPMLTSCSGLPSANRTLAVCIALGGEWRWRCSAVATT